MSSTIQPLQPRIRGVTIDYGHGGIIDGKYQTAGKQYTFMFNDQPPLTVYEGVINRQIAVHVIRYLLEYGVPVRDAVARRTIQTADGLDWTGLEQRDIPLGQRVSYANRTSTYLYLSIHSNAVGKGLVGPSQPARGIDIYTSPGQTGSDKVADTLLTLMARHAPMKVRRGDWSDGDGDMEADFYVLNKTKGLAVLGEVGFFTNIEDARLLIDPVHQANIARAYAYACIDHFGWRV